jgi:hypothetical protein
VLDEKETVARLKQASDALDEATKASKKTLREVVRAKRAVTKAKQSARTIDIPHKIAVPRKRRPKTIS